MNDRELLQLKNEIEDIKTESSKSQGRQEQLQVQLKKEHNCSTIAQAKKELNRLNKKADELQTSIVTGLQEIDEKYEQSDTES